MTYRILIIGPAGPERTSLEAMLSELGHRTTGVSFEEGAATPPDAEHDLVLVVDRRAPRGETWSVAGMHMAGSVPVMVLAGRPARALATLSPGGAELERAGRPDPGSWITPLPNLSDEALAQLVRAGSMPAFETLHQRYAQSLHRYCLSLLRRPHEAEEALQAAMLSAYQALRKAPAAGRDTNIRSWLFRIAHNHSVDALRRRKRRDVEEWGEVEPTDNRGPEQVAGDRAAVRELFDDLAALNEDQRSALVMREFAGLSHVEIGRLLGTTPARVKSLIAQARDTLEAFGAGRELSCSSVRHRVAGADGRVLRSREVRGHLRACPECAAYVTGRTGARQEAVAA
jgi:RNA polymerase sigma factor (sigma-70 family)